MGALQLVKFQSNKRLEEIRNKGSFQAEQNQPILLSLAAHIRRCWEAAKTAKQPIEEQMLRDLRQRNGIYEPDVLAAIREQGGSEIYMMMTSVKCRAAESWIREIELPPQDKAWGLDPSPVADVPPVVRDAILVQLYQEAMAAGWDMNAPELEQRMFFLRGKALQMMQDLADQVADRHETKIHDQFTEGGYYDALDEVVYDFCTFKAAFIKGPIWRRRDVLSWAPMSNGRWVPIIEKKLVEEYDRRSPFDIFPSPGSKGIDDGWFIDRYRFQRDDLIALKDVTGYSNDAIDAILEHYGDKGRPEYAMGDTTRARLENRVHEQYDPMQPIECLNWWGSVPGAWLNEWSNKDDHDPRREYYIEAWMAGQYVFKAAVNEHPLGHKPYSKACYEPIAGAFWGKSLPEIMADNQAMCNAAARALSNNMGIASGPQTEINVDRLADGERVTTLYPWKIHQTTTDLTGNNQPAIRFFQPQSNAQELMIVYQQFERIADNVTGIPNYTHGDAKVSGAGRTSSGLAMLMGTSSKGFRRVLAHFDRHMQAPTVLRTYIHNMLHSDDNSIKGELIPVARGAAELMLKEQMQTRRAELLQATMNPIDAQIIGVEGRAELLRETIKGADLPVDKIMPSPFELELRAAAMPPPWIAAGGGGGSMPGSGVSAPGGTPSQPTQTDAGGNAAGGADQQPAAGQPAPPQQMKDGGVVGRRYRMTKNADGSVTVDPIATVGVGISP